ncbi:MAG: hypothetical protein HON90_02750 [Halobacteriovoraceae bacterium]|nr:hypothetical protein [Halobacteriovoraceae bacterium]
MKKLLIGLTLLTSMPSFATTDLGSEIKCGIPTSSRLETTEEMKERGGNYRAELRFYKPIEASSIRVINKGLSEFCALTIEVSHTNNVSQEFRYAYTYQKSTNGICTFMAMSDKNSVLSNKVVCGDLDNDNYVPLVEPSTHSHR